MAVEKTLGDKKHCTMIRLTEYAREMGTQIHGIIGH